jgi:hypothetical protein
VSHSKALIEIKLQVYGVDNTRDGRGDEDAMITTRSERAQKADIMLT